LENGNHRYISYDSITNNRVRFCIRYLIKNSKCAANGLLEEYTEPAELPPVNGVCGTADQHVYTYTDTSWGKYIGCKVGTSSKPEFPKAGTTANWTCAGIDGGKMFLVVPLGALAVMGFWILEKV